MVDALTKFQSRIDHVQSLEQREIIRVIEAESDAWLAGDIENWKRFWKPGPDAQHISARPSVGAQTMIGLDEMELQFRPLFAKIAKEGRPDRKLKNENWRITVGMDMAWATFEQVLPIDRETVISSGRHHQMRILEKVDGDWKIAALFQISNRYGYYLNPWIRVDANGRVIEVAPGLHDALEDHAALRIVGDRLCGRWKSDTALLRKSIRGADANIKKRIGSPAVPLVLRDANGMHLAPCWVTIADMMIVVLLQDDDLLTANIARAGRAYGLSPTQVRIAKLISQGHDLSVCAEKLGVQPNTVRTHVRRMFERVDVNSQPALVRALLSIGLTR